MWQMPGRSRRGAGSGNGDGDRRQHGAFHSDQLDQMVAGRDIGDPELEAVRADAVARLAQIDLDKCRGCKKCYRACPADAISIIDNEGKGLRKYWAIVDPQKCLGCGVCYVACRWGAHSMVPREARVFTPENTFDRMATQPHRDPRPRLPASL